MRSLPDDLADNDDSVNQIAWLSLDEGDNDPTRFLTYLVTALQMLVPEIGRDILTTLQSPQSPPAEAILTALFNEIAATSNIPLHPMGTPCGIEVTPCSG
ncbi:MAG: hypothetical protein AAF639_39470 [Chloroflexota bacterium]